MKDELEDAVIEISTYEEGEFKSYQPRLRIQLIIQQMQNQTLYWD